MTGTQRAIAAEFMFDGAVVRRHNAVLIEADRIAAVVPRHEVPGSVAVHELPDGAWLAPGFIDVQVNGGGDVLFNDDPTPDAIAAMTKAHRQFGTTSLLATLITDSTAKMRAAHEAVAAAMQRNPSLLGLHLEGPWISPDKPGVHDPAHIRPPQADEIALLTAERRGALLVTLAPEQVPAGLIGELTASGARVSLGHSMATYEESKAAIAEGLTGFTHLFNAMRPLGSREPGPIAAALETPSTWYGLIVDGIHVHPAMLKLALRGAARPMLVTDAMPPVGGTRASFRLNGHEIAVAGNRCTRADGTLAGAAIDMASAVRNAVELAGMPLTAALRAAATEPAHFLGVSDQIGRLAPGCRADLVALEPTEVRVIDTWVCGRRSEGGPTSS